MKKLSCVLLAWFLLTLCVSCANAELWESIYTAPETIVAPVKLNDFEKEYSAPYTYSTRFSGSMSYNLDLGDGSYVSLLYPTMKGTFGTAYFSWTKNCKIAIGQYEIQIDNGKVFYHTGNNGLWNKTESSAADTAILDYCIREIGYQDTENRCFVTVSADFHNTSGTAAWELFHYRVNFNWGYDSEGKRIPERVFEYCAEDYKYSRDGVLKAGQWYEQYPNESGGLIEYFSSELPFAVEFPDPVKTSGALILKQSEPAVIPGDLTGDGSVDGRDLLRLAKFIAGQNVEINEKAADMTGDGKVDGRDVLRLAKRLAGL